MAEGRTPRTRAARKPEDLKLPPQSLEAEISLLGAILLEETALSRVLETRLTHDDFYREGHGLIYQAMLDHFDRGEPVDLITLAETLKKMGVLDKIGGPAYLSELADSVGTAANIEYYANIIRDRSTLRRLITTAARITDRCYGAEDNVAEVLDEAESVIFGIRESRQKISLEPLQGRIKSVIGHIDALMERSGGVTGVPTGYRDLDDLTGGFQPSDLIILAGRPSMGKTALALNIATQTALPPERDVKSGAGLPPWPSSPSKCPRTRWCCACCAPSATWISRTCAPAASSPRTTSS